MKMSEAGREAGREAGPTLSITEDDVRNLMKKKDDMEEQIKAYYDVLEDVREEPCGVVVMAVVTCCCGGNVLW